MVEADDKACFWGEVPQLGSSELADRLGSCRLSSSTGKWPCWTCCAIVLALAAALPSTSSLPAPAAAQHGAGAMVGWMSLYSAFHLPHHSQA